MEITEDVRLLIIDTGNIMTVKEMQRKTSQTPTDELVESCTNTLYEIAKSNGVNMKQKIGDTIECISTKHKTSVSQESRKDLKLTVKVFLSEATTEALVNAVDKTMFHLGVTTIDSLVVSVSHEQLSLPCIQPLWEMLENMVHNERIVAIGCSDLSSTQLEDLYKWSKVKPSINQVNLESCCVMPPEMTAFAKENDIQLLTHNDPKDILPDDAIVRLLNGAVKVTEPILWTTRWIVRYSVMVKGRGIIQSKGFIVCLSRKNLLGNGPA